MRSIAMNLVCWHPVVNGFRTNTSENSSSEKSRQCGLDSSEIRVPHDMTNLAHLSWVIRLHSAEASHLGQLRVIRGVKILTDDEFVWLRGDCGEMDLSRCLRVIPAAEWFTILTDDQLARRQETVPCARLPKGNWVPLDEWIELEMPSAGFAARLTDRVSLRLVRSDQPESANLLQTAWQIWRDYVVSAPQIRLKPLSFAVSNTHCVLVHGTPLPPISGRRFIEDNGLIIPNGWRFEPNVGSTIARRVIQLDESEMALFAEDGSFARLPHSAFVAATRAAVRVMDGP